MCESVAAVMFLWWFGAQRISISLLICSFKGDQLLVLGFFSFFSFWPSGCNYFTLCLTRAWLTPHWTAAAAPQTLLQEDEAQGGFGESACSVELVRPVYLCRESAVTSGRAAGRHTGSQLTLQTAADAESYPTVQLLPVSVQPEDRLEPEFTERKRTKHRLLHFIPNNLCWNDSIFSPMPVTMIIYVNFFARLILQSELSWLNVSFGTSAKLSLKQSNMNSD